MQLRIEMDCEKRIALIGLRSLESLGVRSVIHELGDLSVAVFSDFRDFSPFSVKTDAYVVSGDVFIGNMDYFMPRKQKTVVVGNGSGAGGGRQMPAMIYPDSDESEIQAALRGIVAYVKEDDVIPGELSQREKEVLRLIASGKLNKEIADELCISVNTVITHRKNLSAKLGIKSASGLSLYAIMNGLI